jgi:hypothetical protein
MNAKCPECGEKLVAFRLIQHNDRFMKEERAVIIENEKCLRVFKPFRAVNNPKPFNVYCIDSNCVYGLKDDTDFEKSKSLGILTVSGNMHYTMGRSK